MLFQKPSAATKGFVDIDTLSLASVPTPSVSPAPPTAATSKTNAFFASPFSISIPTPPPSSTSVSGSLSATAKVPPSLQQPSPKVPKRSLTADFFSTGSALSLQKPPTPSTSTSSKSQRHFLNLDMLRGNKNHDPFMNEVTTNNPTSLPPTPSSEQTPRVPPAVPNFTPTPSHSTESFPPSEEEQMEEDAEMVSDDPANGGPAPGTIIRSIPISRPSSSGSCSPSASDASLQVQTLRLTRPLGEGSFSSVWLAQDQSPTPLFLTSKRSLRHLRRKESEKGRLKNSKSSSASLTSSSRIMRRLRGGVSGTRPGGGNDGNKYAELGVLGSAAPLPKRERVISDSSEMSTYSGTSLTVNNDDGFPSTPTSTTLSISLSRASSVSWKSDSSEHNHSGGDTRGSSKKSKGRMVAIKLTSRGFIEGERCIQDDRTRVSFVREVEILKHISHPNITPLLSHLTTKTHHVLVLPHVSGGDLLGLVNGDQWLKLDEYTLRRIFSELCKAVGWMHSVGLVHRDIKLENILLTCNLDDLSPLESNPGPLVKLTDFGLARFIDPTRPLLATRCGSEAYAAPELVIAGGRRGVASQPHPDAPGLVGGYDARETDAWAAGVVLFGLVARRLPFGEGPRPLRDADAFAVGVDGIIHRENKGIVGDAVMGRYEGTPQERRQWLMRIARGEWVWPQEGERALVGEGARRIVKRLLVRDPSRRAKIDDVWDDAWLNLDEEDPSVIPVDLVDDTDTRSDIAVEDSVPNASSISVTAEDEGEEDEFEEELADDAGWLVDQEGIPNIARQEVQ